MGKNSSSIIKLMVCKILVLTSSLNLFGQTENNYFQQRLDYKIKARLDDVNHTVHGNLDVQYTNQSLNNLDTIWFHLWPNAYSGRNTPLCKQKLINRDASLYFSDDAALGKIDSISFLVDGRPVKTYSEGQNPEMVALILNQTLPNGKSVNISTPFKVKVPEAKFSRMGREGEAYYMTQWYPKPAVYDNTGWHPMPYLDQGEFYSEFGDFDVEIDIAANYIVAASGVLLNDDENEKLRELNSIYGSTTTISDKVPASSAERKTLRYRLSNAHDFAWFADKQFQVSLDTVTLTSGKKVAIAVYNTPKKIELWNDANKYSASGLKFLSDAIGDYPYETFTVVDGRISAGGGMEYPSITILNSPSNAESLERVLIHELGHNWFYGALASNERDHPWMDEGINSYYEQLYMAKARKSDPVSQTGIFSNLLEKLLGQPLKEDSLMNLIFEFACFDNHDQPIITKSEEFTSFNYGVIAYMKTARAFGFLFDYLGDELSTKCMHNYYDDWKFRHPQPFDIQWSFEKTTGMDLDWFFKDLLATTDPLRIKISSTDVENQIKVKRAKGPKTPLSFIGHGGKKIWIPPFNNDTTINISDFNFPISINTEYASLLKQNELRFGKSGNRILSKPNVRLFTGLADKPNRYNMTFFPAIGWNSYDNLMAGIYFSNRNLVPRSFEFSVTPLYSTQRADISGTFLVNYHYWPLNGAFKEVEINLSGTSYGYDYYQNNTTTAFAYEKTLVYKRGTAGLNLTLRNNFIHSKSQKRISFRYINLRTEEAVFQVDQRSITREFKSDPRSFALLGFENFNRRKLDPFSYSINLAGADDHLKFFSEFKYRFSYKKERKGLDVRFFAGTFLFNETIRNYNFKMSSWSGADDYLFDGIFLGRNEVEGLWSRQMLVRDGGFITPMALGQSGKWLVALHISSDNPTPLPIRPFFNLGTY
ncbi:MAG: M1 family metallopeptidase, partial [Bacteroidota bacterium]